MSRFVRIVIVAALLAIGARAPRAEANPAATITDNRFGVVESFMQPDLARSAGVRWQRVLFYWNQIQPQSMGQWEPNPYAPDSVVERDAASGMTLVGLIGNPPAWATRNGSVPKGLDLPFDHPENAWGQFVRKAVERNIGEIDSWIIWNEPDIDPGQPYSTWAGSEYEYYQLLKIAYQAAKAANPKARVIFGGTTYWIDSGKDRKLFFERVLTEAKAKDPSAAANGYYFDAVTLHLYSSPYTVYTVPQTYREIMKRFGIDKPVWIDEANVVPYDDPVAPLPKGGLRATQDEQASYIVQALGLAVAANLERFAIYKMQDGKIEGGEAYGLVRNDGTPRPAYTAYQHAVKLLSMPGTVTYRSEAEYDLIQIDGTRRVTLMWSKVAKPVTVTRRAVGRSAQLFDKFGKATPLKVTIDTNKNLHALQLALPTAIGENPGSFLIGGDPVFLVEDEVGTRWDLGEGTAFFPFTGQFVTHGFLRWYDRNYGLEVLGYPRTGQIAENGRTVQYFQRGRLEFFADEPDPDKQVQLGRMGEEAMRGKAAGSPPADLGSRELFTATNHSVGPEFLRYYEARGGATMFGQPVSEDLFENGRWVQYFQKARFEYHPDLERTGNPVMLGLLGDESLRARRMLE